MGLAASVRQPVAAAALLVAPLGLTLAMLGSADAAPLPAQAANEVQANDQNKFVPERIEVPVGGTVTWRNAGSVYHTVTGGENGNADPASPVGDGTLASSGATYQVTFDKAGTYPYFCKPHFAMGMVGQVVVGGAAPSGPPGSEQPSPAQTATAGASGQPSPTSSPTPVGSPNVSPGEELPHGGVPGVDGNKELATIDAERAAQKGTIGGFRAFTAAGTAAVIALCVAVFASTRSRRSGS